MDHSMTDICSVEYYSSTGLERQNLVEVESGASPTEILRVLDQNRKHHIPRLLQAFGKLVSSF
jgi:hypothetical protein